MVGKRILKLPNDALAGDLVANTVMQWTAYLDNYHSTSQFEMFCGSTDQIVSYKMTRRIFQTFHPLSAQKHLYRYIKF